jgi:glycosyltransferase involved in cell wall biosynthesis
VGLFFCASDLVVLPYVTATQSGIVQIAYHYDKPAVVTDVGGLPEVVLDGRTGYVVPSRNPEALAEAVLRFYREHKEAQFVRNVREEKQKYTWSRMAEAVESFMKEG